MKAGVLLLSFALSTALFTSCQQPSATPDSGSPAASARKGVQDNFTAHLTAAQEVRTPPVESKAQGQGLLRFSKDGTEVYFKLIVSNLTDITMAHLHKAVAGQNGGVVVDLIMMPGIPGKSNGVIAEGTFTAASLKGALAGMTLESLRTALQNGEIYFNVHTKAYPGGEVRGQVE
ncbi:CHRD domain-containing protein [Nibrella viscosa]|uniref:CHRD domain-containing protein n=1 Tax=Nibrella viscosa TaxID=1084524 RepID=A0ABP8KF11_9BACT